MNSGNGSFRRATSRITSKLSERPCHSNKPTRKQSEVKYFKAINGPRYLFLVHGADIIAKLSAETSGPRSVAAWDQRIVIPRCELKFESQFFAEI